MLNLLSALSLSFFNTHTAQVLTIYFILRRSLFSFSSFFQFFQGCFDSKTTVRILFENGIESRFIRIHPQTWIEAIAMRVELLGCSIDELVPTTTVATFRSTSYGTTKETKNTTTASQGTTPSGTVTTHMIGAADSTDIHGTTTDKPTTTLSMRSTAPGRLAETLQFQDTSNASKLALLNQLIALLRRLVTMLENLKMNSVSAEAAERIKYSRMMLQKLAQKFALFNSSLEFLDGTSDDRNFQQQEFNNLVVSMRDEVERLVPILLSIGQNPQQTIRDNVTVLQQLTREMSPILNYLHTSYDPTTILDYHHRLERMRLDLKRLLTMLRSFMRSHKEKVEKRQRLEQSLQRLEMFLLEDDRNAAAKNEEHWQKSLQLVLQDLKDELTAFSWNSTEEGATQLAEQLIGQLKATLVLVLQWSAQPVGVTVPPPLLNTIFPTVVPSVTFGLGK
jgi:hypothetical protein